MRKFKNAMKRKFNKETEKHGNSWKIVELYKLREYLKNHVFKWLSNNKYQDNPIQENLDLIDIANYCYIIYERNQERLEK